MSARRAIRSTTLAACLLVFHGCATQSLPPIDLDRVRDSEREALERTRALRGQLFQISYTLRAGGLRLCQPGVLLPDGGLLLGSTEGLAPGLDVLHVVPDSPLARAGVRIGDVLLEIDGRRLRQVSELNERLAELNEQFPSSAQVPATLTVQQGARRHSVSVELPRICAVQVHLAEDPSLMTFQRESSVAVPYGLLETVGENWLAIAIAHQIAHVLIEFASTPVADREATADRLGLMLAAEAGFDVSEAPAFWEWLASENPWRIPSTRAFRVRRPHPTLATQIEYPTAQLHVGIARRLPAIRATVGELLSDQRDVR